MWVFERIEEGTGLKLQLLIFPNIPFSIMAIRPQDQRNIAASHFATYSTVATPLPPPATIAVDPTATATPDPCAPA